MALPSRISMERTIRVICVIALVCLGFAHKPPASLASTLTPAEIAALTLPDGTLPELCLPGSEEGGKSKHHATGSDCAACRITAVAIVAEPSDATGVRLIATLQATLPKPSEAHYRHLFPPNSAPRAPPFSA
ncbi:hypothetical protein FE840_004765 [Peteryoungia desertarenae]|uniref:DUF2946 domain-containing protein n=1 Tax=Peteryoungia desertarenae TaxID=1813451 RepID=A0ABX6QKB0_9HYPH|nr:hypothetical protein [Peteryoungia desertarenae]QLF68907.1 hypothetical protein FE840_004765 [Peteryoungia desertarenae]